MEKTMQQMLDALMARASRGQGEGGTGGAGGGAGGGGQDGYSVAGSSANIPAYGPDRLQFSNSQATSSRGKNRSGKGKGRGDAEVAGGNSIDTNDYRDSTETTVIPENIPAKYRDAVKRYFSDDQTQTN